MTCRGALAGLLLLLVGCGKTISRAGSEQLVLSDAVDQSVASIDFRALSGKKVYLDTTYVREIKNGGFVNAEYIISSLRQQMVAARCLLQDKADDAEYIVEARVGTLGTDANEVTFGLPASNLLSTAATLVPTAPPVPTIPEISLAKRNDQMAAAKVAVFAYNRETRQPLWQSGMSVAKSTAKDVWVGGAGPFQSGSIYKGTRFAGEKFSLSLFGGDADEATPEPLVAYDKETHFLEPRIARVAGPPDATQDDGRIQQVAGEEPADAAKAQDADGDSEE